MNGWSRISFGFFGRFSGRLSGLVAAALALTTIASSAARADDNPWDPGSNWLYLRGGYAKSAAVGAGNGGAGYGFGFRHMLTPSKVNEWSVLGHRPLGILHWTLFKNWSFGGFAEYDVLGRYGTAEEIEIPVALDLTRHLMWKTSARPYVTIGGGPFYRKTYKTGADSRRVAMSGFVASGFDAIIAPGQMLGLDVRLARVDSEHKPINPVFGAGGSVTNDPRFGIRVRDTEATHWSVKLSYALTY